MSHLHDDGGAEACPKGRSLLLKEIRPSKLLFHYDRAGYNQRIEKAKEEQLARLEEHFREQITDAVYGCFEGFHPGHYGVDDLEITFDEVEVSDKTAKVSGNISASARLGSSSAEDSMCQAQH